MDSWWRSNIMQSTYRIIWSCNVSDNCERVSCVLVYTALNCRDNMRGNQYNLSWLMKVAKQTSRVLTVCFINNPDLIRTPTPVMVRCDCESCSYGWRDLRVSPAGITVANWTIFPYSVISGDRNIFSRRMGSYSFFVGYPVTGSLWCRIQLAIANLKGRLYYIWSLLHLLTIPPSFQCVLFSVAFIAIWPWPP